MRRDLIKRSDQDLARYRRMLEDLALLDGVFRRLTQEMMQTHGDQPRRGAALIDLGLSARSAERLKRIIMRWYMSEDELHSVAFVSYRLH